MNSNCEREIRELHAFFEAWYNGAVDDTDDGFSRFGGVMSTDFEIVSPNGGRMDRPTVCRRLRDAHGCAAGASMRIWIEEVTSRQVGANHWLATYQEWQQETGRPEGRLSTALFQMRSSAPNGLIWRHVHEVWLPQDKP